MTPKSVKRLTLIGIVLMAVALVGMSVIGLVVLAGEVAPAPPGVTPTVAVGPSIRLEPAEGEVGEAITVMGEGWRAGDTVLVRLQGGAPAGSDEPAPLAYGTAAADGRFQTLFVIPEDAAPGGEARVLIVARSPATGSEAFAVLAVAGSEATSTLTPTAQPSTPEPTPAETCTDEAAFVADVTVPDNTRLSPGQSFAKTWRLRNSGSCTWTADYALVFSDGDRMAAPASISLPGTVEPGEVVDVSVNLEAPQNAGTYRGNWRLRSEDGVLFDTGKEHGIWVQIVVGPPVVPTPVITHWRGEYYGNRSLTGAPALVRNDVAVSFNWGYGSPASGLASDGFSARWTRTLYFSGGTYRFYAYSDDGVRVWLDGELIVDAWYDATGATHAVDRALKAGNHTLRVEYYENRGVARVQIWWDRVGDTPQWRGEYYANVSLVGAPALVRQDATSGVSGGVTFDWGLGRPAAGLPVDLFSVRWTRVATFEEGLYRFHAVVDDGVRVYVDDVLVVDEWRDGGRRGVSGDVALSAGDHSLRVEYYERTGAALIQVWWSRLSAYPDWRGEYWSNRKLQGSPALVRNDKARDGSPGIDMNWGSGAPASVLPRDDFSARWTREVAFDARTYRFHVKVDDGARLWIDDELVIDDWRDGGTRELTADRALVRGTHELRVEYYERNGDARIAVWWEKVSSPSYPDWKGQYWSNRFLDGEATLVRNDRAIDFYWASEGAAPGLPADNFSARWSRDVTFQAGVYRLYAWSDDGMRIYVDDALVLDEWHDSSGAEVYMVDLELDGTHRVKVTYYEHSGDALAKVWWKRVGDVSTPTPTANPTETPVPSATPTSTPTPTPTIEPTETPVPTATVEPTYTPVPTATPTVTPTVEPTETPTPTVEPAQGDVRLSEILANPVVVDWNGDGAADEQDAWIEVVNAGTAAVDLDGWVLEGGLTSPVRYTVPAGTLLMPGAFAVFYRKNTGIALEDGGQVWLFDSGGAAVAGLAYGTLAADASCSRDSLGVWHVDWPPSPGEPNLPSP